MISKRLELVLELAGIPEDRRAIVRILTTDSESLGKLGIPTVKAVQAYNYIRAAEELVLKDAREKNREKLISLSRHRKLVRLRKAMKAGDFAAASVADKALDERDGIDVIQEMGVGVLNGQVSKVVLYLPGINNAQEAPKTQGEKAK
jgi:hypothetical protein